MDKQTGDNSDSIGYIAVVYQKYTTNFHWRFCTGHDIDFVLIYITGNNWKDQARAALPSWQETKM